MPFTAKTNKNRLEPRTEFSWLSFWHSPSISTRCPWPWHLKIAGWGVEGRAGEGRYHRPDILQCPSVRLLGVSHALVYAWMAGRPQGWHCVLLTASRLVGCGFDSYPDRQQRSRGAGVKVVYSSPLCNSGGFWRRTFKACKYLISHQILNTFIHSLVSVQTHGFLFYSMTYNLLLSLLANGNPLKWAHVLLTRLQHSLRTSLLSGTARCSKFILYFLWSRSEVSHFSKEASF